MVDDSAFFMSPGAFLFLVLFAVGAGAVYAGYNLITWRPPTDEELWVRQQAENCDAMKSRLSYDEASKTARCYRTPFMRKPKLMFEQTYKAVQ